MILALDMVYFKLLEQLHIEVTEFLLLLKNWIFIRLTTLFKFLYTVLKTTNLHKMVVHAAQNHGFIQLSLFQGEKSELIWVESAKKGKGSLTITLIEVVKNDM